MKPETFIVVDPNGIFRGGKQVRKGTKFEASPGGSHVIRWLLAGRIKRAFDPKEGWVTATLTFSTRELQPIEGLKSYLSGGSPENYEFGRIEQTGAKVKAVFRKKPESRGT